MPSEGTQVYTGDAAQHHPVRRNSAHQFNIDNKMKAGCRTHD